MANESINLNLIPEGEMPVIHASQFDNGRQFNINLFKGTDEYTLPAGYTASLSCRKADRTIVTLEVTSALSNTLTFTTTTQLCACAGNNLCEVVIKDSEDYQVGTLNFILKVEKDPLQGGIDSTSEIHDLTGQIEDIATEIIGENYYTKTETDTLLDAKADAADLALVATTGSYNDLNNLPKLNGMTITGNRNAQWYGLASKLNDLSDVTLSLELSEFETLIYNSSLNKWINSKMSYTWLIDKPSIPDAQVQSDYAQSDDTKVDYIKNKPDISGMIEQAIYDIMPVASVSSSAVASFETNLPVPYQSVTVNIVATGGNGTPDNPIPINGYTEANLTRCGKNLIDISNCIDNYFVRSSDLKVVGIEGASVFYCNVAPNTDLTLTPDKSNRCVILGYYERPDTIENSTGNVLIVDSGSGITSRTFNTGNCKFLAIYLNRNSENKPTQIMINIGTTATAYEPYNGNTYTIAFGQTVYGGVLDVTSGKLKPCIEYPSYNGETLSGKWLSSEATYVEGTTPPTGSQVVSLDDYGANIDLTPVQISAIVGGNNVYADCGNTAVKYKDTIQHYIDTRS